jgi:hypothetical protein
VGQRRGVVGFDIRAGKRSLWLSDGTQESIPADMSDDEIVQRFDLESVVRAVERMFTMPVAVDGPMRGQPLYASRGALGERIDIYHGDVVYTYVVSQIEDADHRHEATFLGQEPRPRRRTT